MQNTLRLTEIFYSIQGESLYAGLPTVFVRLTGCPLRCEYCDTAYAFQGGQRMVLPDILTQIESYDTPYVCVTGGEPLAQKNALILLNQLCDKGYTVSLETSGALPIDKVDQRVTIIMDIKTPDSKESDKNLLSNLSLLKKHDQVKFVIGSYTDFIWAVEFIRETNVADVCEILFSPSYHQVSPKDLAEWILASKIRVRLQIQLHKLLWQDERGR